MAILQVKSMPDELYAGLQTRAKAQGMSMSEYVVRVLRKDLSRPTTSEWLSQVEERLEGEPLRDIDVVTALDGVRAEFGSFERPGE
ncbi:hypothetical protein [Gryllotalpicola protaetiae]|uniref:Antitoxin n=1 Tax=Gryllotalpicola protaetiae TaxID=2419771 RepID=A0A387BUH5_9MICO|nr:hypothetical protein [Gryllotalpicola protaetiae]AYG02111.1 hypothetical protein D7I44_00220 [Gryllotalpicola protaetiae]